eukprot:c6600_g1_i1 orf=116-343(-)
MIRVQSQRSSVDSGGHCDYAHQFPVHSMPCFCLRQQNMVSGSRLDFLWKGFILMVFVSSSHIQTSLLWEEGTCTI